MFNTHYLEVLLFLNMRIKRVTRKWKKAVILANNTTITIISSSRPILPPPIEC